MPIILDTTYTTAPKTLEWARTRVSRRVEGREGYYSGVVTAGTAASLVDTNLPWGEEPNHWSTGEILAISGQNLGLVRTVSASTSDGLTFPPFPYTFAIGDTYELRRKCIVDNVDSAIQESILDTFNKVWMPSTGTATWADGTETYTLPADMVLLSAVEYTDDSGINHPIRFQHWRCPMDGTVVLDSTALAFFSASTPGVTDQITFRGWRYPIIPEAPTDPIEAPETFVVYSAIAALRSEGYSSPATDADNDAGAFSTFMQYAQSRGRKTPVPPNTKRAR